MKYTPKECDENPIVEIVAVLKLNPQQPVSIGFLNFCSLQFYKMGLICETNEDVTQALEWLGELGAFHFYHKKDSIYITPKV